MIDKMSNHYIICGCGRIGHLIGRELKAEKVPFVVIDSSVEVIERIAEEGFIYCKGYATQDKCIIEAGVKRARGLSACFPRTPKTFT